MNTPQALILFLAGLCEVGWAMGLKYTAGFPPLAQCRHPGGDGASVVLLGWSLKALPWGRPTRCGPASAPSVRHSSA